MRLNLEKSIIDEYELQNYKNGEKWTALQKKWDRRFLELARTISHWSKDPSTKVGTIAVGFKNKIIGTGYNGFPAGIEDDERLNNRETKYKIILHAECNCVINLGHDTPYKIYTYPLPPCSRCAAMIIQAGFHEVISMAEWPERWDEDIQLSLELFKEANVEVRLYDNYNIVVL